MCLACCRYCEVLEQINSLEPRMQALTETELKAKTGTRIASTLHQRATV